MKVTESKVPDHHNVSLEGRREAFRVARAMGPNFSGLKMGFVALFMGGQDVDFRINTTDLLAFESRLQPPSPDLQAYLGQLTVPLPETVAETVVQANGINTASAA